MPGLHLDPEERELVLAEVRQALAQARTPEMEAALQSLATAAEQGDVPEPNQPTLEDLLEVGLMSGRIRRLYTAHGEMAANRIYGRTARGRSAREGVQGVNDALSALAGTELRDVAVAGLGPGVYTLRLNTSAGSVLLRIDRREIRVQSVEVA